VSDALLETNIASLEAPKRGKVRDIYTCGDRLLIVASDRISAFDSVMPNGIPDKGRILTQLSSFWFDFTKKLAPNHVITTDVNAMELNLTDAERAALRGRSTLARKAKVVPIECVVRGYLAGSGWKEYQESGTVCGIKLPEGLTESDKLPAPIFTPATKAESGHDENISFERMVEIVGTELATTLRDKSIAVYRNASEHAASRGVIICDTKFEWGQAGGELILVDEVLTPDSSRFWPADQYKPGGPQPSYDKQFVRDYLVSIGWDKEPPAPPLSDEVVAATREKYMEALRVLAGVDGLAD
jgi:phosphoribosylaminoimidazole-succinocarboxamide synthase